MQGKTQLLKVGAQDAHLHLRVTQRLHEATVSMARAGGETVTGLVTRLLLEEHDRRLGDSDV